MDSERELDSLDYLLLGLLQTNGRATTQQLAQHAMRSSAPCWRRVKQLEKDGVIEGYVAVLNPQRVGLNLRAYIHVTLENHHAESVAEFDAFVDGCPEITECCTVSGEHDYLLRVIVRDVAALEHLLMQRLLAVRVVKSANTSIVLRQTKFTTALPLSTA